MLRLCASSILLLAGCSAAVEPAAELELGTGTWRFESLEDGQSLDMIRGAQGGWHVWVSVRVSSVDVDEARLTLTLEPADESDTPDITEVDVRFDPPDDQGRRVFLGWPAIVSDASCRMDELLRVEARVNVGDRVLESERYITPAGGAFPPPPCTTL